MCPEKREYSSGTTPAGAENLSENAARGNKDYRFGNISMTKTSIYILHHRSEQFYQNRKTRPKCEAQMCAVVLGVPSRCVQLEGSC